MPPNQSSDIATKQEQALVKGPIAGAHGLEAGGKLHYMDDKIVVPASTLTTAQRLRFGKLPAGARIVPNATQIVSNHSATIAGAVNLRPLDGVTAPTAIAGAVINLEATTTSALPDAADYATLTKDSWVEFVPTADTTFAGTVTIRARIGYLLNS